MRSNLTDMSIRVGINGFGRIGRNFYRVVRSLESVAGDADAGADIEVVAINDLGAVEVLAHLLAHDSVHGRLDVSVSVEDGHIRVGDDSIQVLSVRNPEELPWSDLGVDVVVESTGVFTARQAAARHLDGGAPRVVVSAPSSGADKTFVVGVNDSDFNPDTDFVVSNASCTTNCFVPMVKVLDDAFGVEKGLMTTIHAYTGGQALVDTPQSDLRRARAAAVNIVPTSTGAARATSLVLQAMAGKLDGIAMRIPIPDGSITDFTAKLSADVTVQDVNEAFAEAASSKGLGRVLNYSEAPLVSTDIVGSSASCTFDSGLTMAIGDLVKVSGWYDNEWGYSSRLADLVAIVGVVNR